MTLLCIDAGNTRTKWGLRQGQRWRAQGACAHGDIGLLAATLPVKPRRVLACNVAGRSVGARIRALARSLGASLECFTSTTTQCGVSNGYDTPTQLGADRWAALIGARGLHAGSALVVMAGTATTVDALEADGRFAGGLILPGLKLMQAALAKHTARLPEACGSYHALPTNTDDAIASGALHATLGAIERMARRPAGADFCVILSGGAADQLAPHLDFPVMRVDNLVLEGLARTASEEGAHG